MGVEAAVDWRDSQVSATEAVSLVRPGDKVFVGKTDSGVEELTLLF